MALQKKAEARVKHYTQDGEAWVRLQQGAMGKLLIHLSEDLTFPREQASKHALQRHAQVTEGTIIPQHDTIYAHVLVTNCVMAYIHLFPG